MSFRQYRPFQNGEFIVVGYDLAMGGDDYSTAVFLSRTNVDVPLIYHSKEIATIATNKILPVLSAIRGQTGIIPVVAPERNAGGSYEIDRMLDTPNATDFTMYREKPTPAQIDRGDSVRYGWSTNTGTRSTMLKDLKSAIDGRMIGIHDELLIHEMFSFIVNRTTMGWRAQAERGMHDDMVMALAIAWQLYQTETPTHDSQYVDLPQNNFAGWEIG